MSLHVIADRYATALSRAIADPAELASAAGQLDAFAQLYTESNELRTVLEDPAIAPATRAGILNDVCERLQLHPAVHATLSLMLRRGRLQLAQNVAAAFQTLADKRSNRTTARVQSAMPLTEAQREKLRAGLGAFAGKEIALHTSIDPTLGGGVVVHLDGKILDGSLRTRLDRIKETLLTER